MGADWAHHATGEIVFFILKKNERTRQQVKVATFVGCFIGLHTMSTYCLFSILFVLK